jgi:hypothetical protein
LHTPIENRQGLLALRSRLKASMTQKPLLRAVFPI